MRALRGYAAVALMLGALAAHAAVPSFVEFRARYAASEARLLDRHGELLHELRIDAHIRRLDWIALQDVSPALLRAVVRAEDRRFYTHHGVDWRAIAGAAWSVARGHRARGASTISMQVAARLDPALESATGRRSIEQKWRQMQAARELERSWSKAQILEAYLNLVDFRSELQGVAAAARGIFDKDPSGLNEAESLLLAVLLRAPNAAPAAVAARACDLGETLSLSLACVDLRRLALARLAGPYRVRPVVADAPHVAHRLLNAANATVTSTLDARLQRYATHALLYQLGALSDERVRDGAVLVVDNRSGEVLAYVGNRGESFVDGVVAPRQAGSSLKPFLYELAFERRLLTAASIIDDSPLNIAIQGGLYAPQDYDHDFKGPVSARTGLASSLNVPAVRTLMLVGGDAFVARLRRLGFVTLSEDADYYGYALALGSGEVRLWDLVNAYRTLANGGRYSPLSLTPRRRLHAARVMDPRAAYIVSDILADRSARSLTFGLENVLAAPFWAAVKTGTSKDMRDNWCIGYSDRFTVGVWVGNFSGEPMRDVSGVTGAAPVWLEVMRYLHQGRPGRAPKLPPGIVTRRVTFMPAFEQARDEPFIAGTEASEVIARDDAAQRPVRIAYPGDGAILATDPDIPVVRQRVFFVSDPANGPWHWRIDGRILDASEGWTPKPGRHRLELVDTDGAMRDSVSFSVRGQPLPTMAPLGDEPSIRSR